MRKVGHELTFTGELTVDKESKPVKMRFGIEKQTSNILYATIKEALENAPEDGRVVAVTKGPAYDIIFNRHFVETGVAGYLNIVHIVCGNGGVKFNELEDHQLLVWKARGEGLAPIDCACRLAGM